jgi:hypothetical protein
MAASKPGASAPRRRRIGNLSVILPAMSERFQFNLRHVLLATTEMAVCFALLATHNTVERHLARDYALLGGLYYGLIVGLPAAAVGALFARPGLGAMCGLASALAVVGIILTD